MAVRKTTRPDEVKRRSTRKRAPRSASRQFSAVAGGALILIAVLWFAWLLLHQFNPALVSFTFPLPNNWLNSASAPADPLVAAGITLSAPAQGQEPLLTSQQATLLVNEMEPQAAAQVSTPTASYTLFSYKSSNSVASFHNVPVWLVHYTGISEPSPDTSADTHAAGKHHDLYVFLDANSGKELLAVWL